MYVNPNLRRILCTNTNSKKVLHTTSNLHKTLANCRSLLRTGGRLFLLELCSGKRSGFYTIFIRAGYLTRFLEAKWVNYIMVSVFDIFLVIELLTL